MKTTFLQYPFQGKKVLIRVDFNVPLDKKTFEITDDTRIRLELPTINHILDSGGSVILMSHLGRPKGVDPNFSLKHILPYIQNTFKSKKVEFASDCIGESAKNKAAELEPGQILLLENLRFYKEEEQGDPLFAKKLADLGDVYVNDAFGTAHRAHASTAVIADYFSAANRLFGLLMESEITQANKVLINAQLPFTAILGGAKVSDKIQLIENFLFRINKLIIGGGMAFTFVKALGGNVGNSLCEMEQIDLVKNILDKAKEKGVKIYLPIDIVAADKFDNNAETKVVDCYEIPDGWMGLDIGFKTIRYFTEVIESSKTILWNGPMGVFEMSSFQSGTSEIAHAVANATKNNGAFSLVGGGDSIAAVNKFSLANNISFISTGGGAMLEYLEGKDLPGILAIQKP